MTVLRVLVDAAPAADRPQGWALYDSAGGFVRKGTDRRAEWPAADRMEVVVAASQVRIATIALPPMPQSRIASAATFALEDQLAGPNTTHELAVSPQSQDGRVRVAIAARSLIDAIAHEWPNATRIVAECDLALPANDWRWCSRAIDAPGFVRRPDGSAFPADPPSADRELPAELTLALQQARRAQVAGLRVRVDAPVAPASAASLFPRWQHTTGVEFIRGTPWEWEAVGSTAFANAVDLKPDRVASAKASARTKPRRLFVPAMLFAAAALTLHVVASSIEWASLRFEAWRDAREWMALATASGIPHDATPTRESARIAFSRRYAQIRHDHGLSAPEDALPLLARAAPALATLPPGTVKRASYADGHWILDLALANPAAIGDLELRMRGAGVPALVAPSPTGVRMRIGGS